MENWWKCLDMWAWINYQLRIKPRHLETLKKQYLTEFDPSNLGMSANCYFCEAAEGCWACPAKEVDEMFHCQSQAYSYLISPMAFFMKVQRLNKKRIGRNVEVYIDRKGHYLLVDGSAKYYYENILERVHDVVED